MYVTEVSPRLTSSVTDAVIEEVKAWQRSGHNSLSGHRHQPGRQEGGAGPVDRPDRRCHALVAGRLRIEEPGRADIFIACVDGLKGFPEAIEAV
jgi:putative transposase